MENSKAKSCCISKDSMYNCGILLFRCIVGGFMLTHGWQKLQNFDMLSTVFPDPLGVGSTISLVLIILAEFGCSLLIIIGLFTRLATLPLIFGMAIAAIFVHANDPFATKELAFLYMALYVVVSIVGGGKYSLDNVFLNFCSKKYNNRCCHSKK